MATATRPLAVVTGASSGIGLELARQFAENGFDLIIAAEDAAITSASASIGVEGARIEPVQVDLATAEGVEQLYARIAASGRPIEAIAINAGVGVNGDFSRDTELEAELRVIQLNVMSTVHLTKRVVKDMVARGRGRILITSSIAALMPSPFMAVYGATKAFDLAFAESLREELKDTGVSVTALLPGPTDTDFFRRADMEDTKAAESSSENDPADVARQGFKALMAGDERVIAASLKTKLQGALARFLPEQLKAKWHRAITEPGSANASNG